MHSEENCQRPQIWPLSLSQNEAKNKKGKSTDHDQNLISSEGGQDTSACQSSGHSSLGSPENVWSWNLVCFTKSKWCQNEENQQMMTKILSALKWSGYISMSNFGPFKVTAIKLRFVLATTLSEKQNLKKMWKIEIWNFGQTRNLS